MEIEMESPRTPHSATGSANPVPAERLPLITSIFAADPSAHVFDGRIYIYPSHDIPSDAPSDDTGDQYDMRDYHVFSLDGFGSPAVDHGVALEIGGVPWASKAMWAPDASRKGGRYFLYFPAKDREGIFRIGVATGSSPEGPFAAESEPIVGSFSVDPAVFVDDDGSAYMYFGGLWGGQLQRWQGGAYDSERAEPSGDSPALGPRVARLSPDMLGFEGPVREAAILGEGGRPLAAREKDKRFFEASWMHKREGKYYLSYSTGDTHFLACAVGSSPLGPFEYRGRILSPVLGWTTHHSIVDFQGRWYIFYHDASLSGRDNLRTVKYQELRYDAMGDIVPMDP
jgi:hypothetical protein